MNLYGLVLSGGESRRMGRDKGALIYHPGEDQRSWCFRILNSVCSSVFISCRQEQDSLIPISLPRIYDSKSGIGPAAGILSAFAFAPDVAWFVWACDMPFVRERDLYRLVQHRNPRKSATLYQSSEGLEPLFAIWEPSALVALEKACRNGQCSQRRILESLDCEVLIPGAEQNLVSVNEV